MDLTSIEATSVAVAAGQRAAAVLCYLLSAEEDEPGNSIEDWFDPQPRPVPAAAAAYYTGLQARVERLGGYVCHSADPVSGERLYRWAVIEAIAPRAEWADQPFARRQAFEIFAATVRAVYLPLRLEQQRLDRKPAPQQTRLALEDSIFEPTTSLGELRPESVAAAPLVAAYEEGQQREAGLARAERLALEIDLQNLVGSIRNIAELSLEQIRDRLIAETARRSAAAPLSIGEAPARHRPNRGGRGKQRP